MERSRRTTVSNLSIPTTSCGIAANGGTQPVATLLIMPQMDPELRRERHLRDEEAHGVDMAVPVERYLPVVLGCI